MQVNSPVHYHGFVNCSYSCVHHLYRLGQPDDCAGTVSFLCSDDASYITGEIILVTGGMQARL